MPDILIVNNSRLIATADIGPVIAAINKQIADDFAPEWNAPGTIYFGSAPGGAWQFSLQDTIDQSGDLGYHVDQNGVVSAIIDVAACKQYGSDWRTCLGHEILEALVDPLCTRMGDGEFAGFLAEVADPVEEDVYAVDGIPVTNFVLPAYFGWSGSRYDHMGLLNGPAPALRPGGYLMRLVNNSWTTTYGERAASRPGFMASRTGGRRAWRQKMTALGPSAWAMQKARELERRIQAIRGTQDTTPRPTAELVTVEIARAFDERAEEIGGTPPGI